MGAPPERSRSLDWSRARPLLARVLAAPAEEREELLEHAALREADLVRDLRRLLRAGSKLESLLDPGAQPDRPAPPETR